jgi:hypothetical protein
MEIVAILLSPVIAVGVTLWYQARKERRDTKRWLFSTLIATRHSPLTDESVRALNMIDVVFSSSQRVRQLWREYYDMLHNEGLNNPAGWAARSRKHLELITEMAKVLGYGKEISHLDVDRVYYPAGLAGAAATQSELYQELLRVLKNTQSLQLPPKSGQ